MDGDFWLKPVHVRRFSILLPTAEQGSHQRPVCERNEDPSLSHSTPAYHHHSLPSPSPSSVLTAGHPVFPLSRFKAHSGSAGDQSTQRGLLLCENGKKITKLFYRFPLTSLLRDFSQFVVLFRDGYIKDINRVRGMIL